MSWNAQRRDCEVKGPRGDLLIMWLGIVLILCVTGIQSPPTGTDPNDPQKLGHFTEGILPVAAADFGSSADPDEAGLPDEPEEIHGVYTADEIHGVYAAEEIHGVYDAEDIHGVYSAGDIHGVYAADDIHGVDDPDANHRI